MDRLSEYVIKHSGCYLPRCEYVENDIEIDCNRCKEIMIQEHDTQIREDAIDEYKLKLLNLKSNNVTNIDKATLWVEFKEQAIEIAEQLKEQI